MAKLTYFSHAAVMIENKEHCLLIDPYITGNPNAPIKANDLNPDFILVTHGHADHLGDTISIAKRTGATVVAPYELAVYCNQKGVENIHPMHIGGAAKFPFGRVKLTQALHGSASPEGTYTGNPCGFVITIDGKNVYHAGDTGLFKDMELIKDLDPLDIALLPIGGNFTMDVSDAVIALYMLKPKLGIPIHYNTFPQIQTNPEEFVKLAEEKGLNAKILQFGESIEF